jgi:hypothetical protein
VRARAPRDALFLGGKSMGGRIATQLVAGGSGSSCRGLVALGYPLHPPGKKGRTAARAEHLYLLKVPLLVVQGARDPFGGKKELGPVVSRLPRGSRLVVVPEGDHSLAVPKRAGVPQEKVYDDVADAIVAFCTELA